MRWDLRSGVSGGQSIDRTEQGATTGIKTWAQMDRLLIGWLTCFGKGFNTPT